MGFEPLPETHSHQSNPTVFTSLPLVSQSGAWSLLVICCIVFGIGLPSSGRTHVQVAEISLSSPCCELMRHWRGSNMPSTLHWTWSPVRARIKHGRVATRQEERWQWSGAFFFFHANINFSFQGDCNTCCYHFAFASEQLTCNPLYSKLKLASHCSFLLFGCLQKSSMHLSSLWHCGRSSTPLMVRAVSLSLAPLPLSLFSLSGLNCLSLRTLSSLSRSSRLFPSNSGARIQDSPSPTATKQKYKSYIMDVENVPSCAFRTESGQNLYVTC